MELGTHTLFKMMFLPCNGPSGVRCTSSFSAFETLDPLNAFQKEVIDANSSSPVPEREQVVCSILEAMLHVQSAQAAPFDREQPDATANVQPE